MTVFIASIHNLKLNPVMGFTHTGEISAPLLKLRLLGAACAA